MSRLTETLLIGELDAGDPADWHTLNMVVDGQQVWFFIDNIYLGSVAYGGGSTACGQVGVGGYNFEEVLNVILSYQNYSVRSIDAWFLTSQDDASLSDPNHETMPNPAMATTTQITSIRTIAAMMANIAQPPRLSKRSSKISNSNAPVQLHEYAQQRSTSIARLYRIVPAACHSSILPAPDVFI